ncbi:hypothetical protein [Intestinibacter bartlettii]|uniref:Uncharacterized protein n=1 Tax=Intestinibacter bartlettii TaxID=261299 RepID=A0ABS6DW57_9FIRM|nr:hypothetical protein [Intestinibacter bartlettii]MBU5335937.1 hypothetical protein [Intestinibacter bartlettii]MDO5010261.1 hypothetical protein [Intestinibacter bartlettii]
MNLFSKTILGKSISILSNNLYKKKLETLGFVLLSLLLGSICLFAFSALIGVEMKSENGNMSYICTIVKSIESIVILLITMRILMTESEVEEAKKYSFKNCLVLIVSFIVIVIIAKLVDILVVKNYKLEFYNIIGRTDEFALVRAIVMYLFLSVILAIPVYLVGYRIFNFVKKGTEVSLLKGLKSFIKNIIRILICWILFKGIEVLSCIFILKYYMVCGVICSIANSLYLALVVSIAYTSVEEESKKITKSVS